jgi:hypothetical protein
MTFLEISKIPLNNNFLFIILIVLSKLLLSFVLGARWSAHLSARWKATERSLERPFIIKLELLD